MTLVLILGLIGCSYALGHMHGFDQAEKILLQVLQDRMNELMKDHYDPIKEMIEKLKDKK